MIKLWPISASRFRISMLFMIQFWLHLQLWGKVVGLPKQQHQQGVLPLPASTLNEWLGFWTIPLTLKLYILYCNSFSNTHLQRLLCLVNILSVAIHSYFLNLSSWLYFLLRQISLFYLWKKRANVRTFGACLHFSHVTLHRNH